MIVFDYQTGFFTPMTAASIQGRQDGTSVAPGTLGYTTTANVPRSAPIATVANTPKTVASITVAGGVYLLGGAIGWRTAGATTQFFAAFNTTTNTLPTGDTFANFAAGKGVITNQNLTIAAANDWCIPLPSSPIFLSLTTTIYLVQQSDAANNVYGFIFATEIG